LPQVFYQLGYHGSPYFFDAFTLAHIGSGEGAKAHGWGLYFALSRAVAEGYRKKLKKDYLQEIEITYKGRPFSEFDEAFMEEVRKSSEEVPDANTLEEAQRAYEESLKQSQLLKLNAAAAVSYARMAHIAPDQVDDIAAKLVWTDERKALSVPEEYFSQEAQERLNLPNRSRQLDEQIHKWREGDTTEKFDLGSPSWVLQLFGAKKDSNVKIFGKSFLHAILKPGETLRRQRGKHGLTDEEVRGLLVGIQRPIAVFRSKNIDAKSGEESIVLLTELTQNGKSVVAPLWLTYYKNGTIVVDNQVPTAFAKSNIKQWIDEGLLLGYEKEKGLSLLLESMGSNRQQLGTSNRDKPLINGAIVYQNDTSLGDLYQIIGNIETRYNDAIVRDFDGNIVPLSKRFNSRKREEFYQVGYHGTPYLFDAFTLAHIGSGEGAQAHGQYFALSKRTPEDYARRLSSWIDNVQLLKLSRSLKKTGATPLLRHHSWEPLFWCCSKFSIFSTSFPVQFM
jgi:hypothetical protein